MAGNHFQLTLYCLRYKLSAPFTQEDSHMPETSLSYNLIAAAFVCVVNLIAFMGLWLNFSASKKPYLAIVCGALVVETLRQIPDSMILSEQAPNSLFVLSMLPQFLASFMFLYALFRIRGAIERQVKVLLGALALVYVCTAVFHITSGLPQSTLAWYVVYSPIILASLAISWLVFGISSALSAGKVLLVLSSLSLLIIRISQPSIDTSFELIGLIYYMEVLLFPIMATALNFFEIENTHMQVQSLLDEKTQSEKDLQFILDNSLDIILITNHIGLILSWNKRAEGVFGYNDVQSIDKIHIDELFYGNQLKKNEEEFEEFEATMENIDGKTFPVVARMKTVSKRDNSYCIYVIREQDRDEAKYALS